MEAADGALFTLQGVTDIDWRDVVLETKIGAGAFGNVYKGEAQVTHQLDSWCIVLPGAAHASELVQHLLMQRLA